jgi:hypothetical protein
MTDLTDAEILAITDKKILFDDDPKVYARRRSHCHPDKPKGNKEVFIHLTKVWEGTATSSSNVVIKTKSSTLILRDVRICRTLTSGFIEYITVQGRWLEHSIDWVDLVDRIKKTEVKMKVQSVKFKNDFPNKDADRALYQIVIPDQNWATPGGGFVSHYPSYGMMKLTDCYAALDLLPDNTKVWIITRLLILACSLETMKLVTLSMASSSFICPKKHDLRLCGGLECLYSEGQPVDLFPTEISDAIAPGRLGKKTDLAAYDLHRSQIRAIARRILYPKFPDRLMKWLSDPQKDAISDLGLWYDGLHKMYGKIVFTETPVTFDQVYPPK